MDKLRTARSFVAAHERQILLTALAFTTATTAVLRTGIIERDEFLRANNLFEEFVNSTPAS